MTETPYIHTSHQMEVGGSITLRQIHTAVEINPHPLDITLGEAWSWL